jgi:uncharacterized protein with NRDE domain
MERRGGELCTLTVYNDRIANRLLVGFNRDEKRTRQTEIPIQHSFFPSGGVISPKDVESGGTWIALNQSGLLFCLLNVNEPADLKPAQGNLKSRGGLIPLLWHSKSLVEVSELLLGIQTSQYPFFRLVIIQKPDDLLADEVKMIEFINHPRLLAQATPFLLKNDLFLRASSSILETPLRLILEEG